MKIEMTTLGEVVALQRGHDLTESQRRPGSVPVVGSAGIHGYHDTAKAKGPGVTVGRSGASFGKVTFIPEDFWPHNTTLFVTDFKGNGRIFIRYLLESLDFSSLNSGSAQQSLNRNFLYGVPVPKFSLPTQRRIAHILSAYDELMENCQRRIRMLEELSRSIYREWFVHFRFPDHEKVPYVDSAIGPIPRGWEAVAFTEIADVLSGGTPKTDAPEYWDGTIPFFTPRDVPACFYVWDTDKHTNELGLSKCASELYSPGTVFITARGTVGKVAMPSVPMAMNQSCYALRGKHGIPQRFLFLMTLQQVDYLKTNTGGATFDTIVVDTFRRMVVAKPPFDLVARFAHLTNAAFDAVNNLTQKVANLRRTRDLLLPQLLSGKVEFLS